MLSDKVSVSATLTVRDKMIQTIHKPNKRSSPELQTNNHEITSTAVKKQKQEPSESDDISKEFNLILSKPELSIVITCSPAC